MGTAFAQKKPAAAAGRKNAVALDVFPLFKGFIASDFENDYMVIPFSLAYERLIVPHFSVGPDVEFYYIKFNKDLSGFYFSGAIEGRYYPESTTLEKFFFGTTLGVNVLSVDGKTKTEEGGFIGLIVSLKIGYKIITSPGFYMEPSFGYVLSKTSIAGALPTPLGWNGGLRVGFAF
jgi:hypothetical protein